MLMADKMYLQKASEFTEGEYIGKDKDGNLYKGIVTFMIVGIKTRTSYVIKASPEVRVNGSWLANELDGCISLLADNGFQLYVQ